MSFTGLTSGLVRALAALAPMSAQPAAAASYCSGGSADGLSLADMTFNGALATDCYGVVAGNDKLSTVDSLDWGDGWTLLTKDESALPVVFMGIEFDLDTTGGQSGAWTLAGSDVNGAPMELDVVAVLKASNRYALYYFDNVGFDGTVDGTWSIAFRNHGGQIPDLSHMSFYVRPVPEAKTYAMMLVGLGLVGFMARRARKAA
jgi:hypothetical protein